MVISRTRVERYRGNVADDEDVADDTTFGVNIYNMTLQLACAYIVAFCSLERGSLLTLQSYVMLCWPQLLHLLSFSLLFDCARRSISVCVYIVVKCKRGEEEFWTWDNIMGMCRVCARGLIAGKYVREHFFFFRDRERELLEYLDHRCSNRKLIWRFFRTLLLEKTFCLVGQVSLTSFLNC